MQIPSFEQPWIKKNRLLTCLLIGSLTVNVILFTTVCCRGVQSITMANSKKYVKMRSLDTVDQIIYQLEKVDQESVVQYLQDKTRIEYGICVRDLALFWLIKQYHLDIERILPMDTYQKKYIKNSYKDSFVFYGLSDRDFAMLYGWIRQGNFIVNMQKLFTDLQKNFVDVKEDFYVRSEFCMLYAFLQTYKKELSKEHLLKLLAKNSIDCFIDLVDLCKHQEHPTIEHARIVLQQHYPQSSSLWMYIDADFIRKNFTDEDLLIIIENIEEDHPDVYQFLQNIIEEPRSPTVHVACENKLFALYGEQTAMEAQRPTTQQISQKEYYVVQDGDSLWKIAKKYQITTEAIKQENHLEKDMLHPGQELTIPLSE